MWKVNEDGFMECVKDFRVKDFIVRAGTIGAKLPEKYNISTESWIEASCEIGENVYIECGCHVGACTQIGAGTSIHSHVVIGKFCCISSDVEIEPMCQLADGVRIRSNVKLGHGCQIGYRSLISAYSRLGSRCRTGKESTIGSGCTIEYNCEIGNFVAIHEDCHLCDNVKIADRAKVGFGTGIRPSINIPREVEVPAQQWIEPDNFMVFVNQGTRCRPVFMMFDSRASSKNAGDVMVTVGCQDCITFTKFLSRIKNAIGTTDKSALMYRQNIPLFKAARKRIILNRARSVTKRILVHLGF